VPMIEFGNTAGKIAWVIALASIIGTAMLESGAAERMVNAIISLLGEKRAPIALLISGFVLSIPIFFDTVFFLMIPIAIALVKKTGKDYLLYILAISGGGLITHCLVPPTPGPLIMAENMNIDLGVTILAGLAFGILPAWGVYKVARYRNKKYVLPLRVAVGQSDSSGSLPGLFYSIIPILLPLLLISISSVTDVLMKASKPAWISFLGNKNVAMTMGTAVALWVWARQKKYSGAQLWEACGKPLEIAGIIILITSAGGAFGAMLGHSGIGAAIKELTTHFNINYILLAWLISAIMKIAQGSSTVAMITTSSIMYALIQSGDPLSYNPVYILMSIGFGSLFVPWMNDSGFWVVSRMSGMTTAEALKNYTVTIGSLAVIGLVELLIMSSLLPLV
ncbi:MAG: GntP family permease, partial [Bacteroidia bacterium]|nr:GntP family permease [Bacteroidia bacterium]